jgi:alpha-ketoglutarate-dependent taurine dioxygenase
MAELVFDCIGARVDRYAAVPSFGLDLRISETSGEKIDAIALRVQIRIEPFRRHYSDAEAERLNDLFGERVRWADTLKPLQFTTISTMVPGLTGSIEVPLPVPFTYDLQIASTRYFSSLDDGEIPLLLLFSGTVFYRNPDSGTLAVAQVPWHKDASFRLPVPAWRELIDMYFPNSGWIRLHRDTVAALCRFKSAQAVAGWDEAFAMLLERAGEERP